MVVLLHLPQSATLSLFLVLLKLILESSTHKRHGKVSTNSACQLADARYHRKSISDGARDGSPPPSRCFAHETIFLARAT